MFPGTGLADCSFLAPDIKACQAKGKIVTMSFGGATGAGLFSSAKAASDYADLVWNTFLGLLAVPVLRGMNLIYLIRWNQ